MSPRPPELRPAPPEAAQHLRHYGSPEPTPSQTVDEEVDALVGVEKVKDDAEDERVVLGSVRVVVGVELRGHHEVEGEGEGEEDEDDRLSQQHPRHLLRHVAVVFAVDRHGGGRACDGRGRGARDVVPRLQLTASPAPVQVVDDDYVAHGHNDEAERVEDHVDPRPVVVVEVVVALVGVVDVAHSVGPVHSDNVRGEPEVKVFHRHHRHAHDRDDLGQLHQVQPGHGAHDGVGAVGGHDGHQHDPKVRLAPAVKVEELAHDVGPRPARDFVWEVDAHPVRHEKREETHQVVQRPHQHVHRGRQGPEAPSAHAQDDEEVAHAADEDEEPGHEAVEDRGGCRHGRVAL